MTSDAGPPSGICGKASTTTLSDRYLSYRWFVLLPLAAIYVVSLPHAVQILDSAHTSGRRFDLALPERPE